MLDQYVQPSCGSSERLPPPPQILGEHTNSSNDFRLKARRYADACNAVNQEGSLVTISFGTEPPSELDTIHERLRNRTGLRPMTPRKQSGSNIGFFSLRLRLDESTTEYALWRFTLCGECRFSGHTVSAIRLHMQNVISTQQVCLARRMRQRLSDCLLPLRDLTQ